MLFGEHAVIYGYPCIVTAVDKYVTVEIEKIVSDHDILITPDVSDTSFVRNSIGLFRKKFRTDGKISLKTYSELGNYGLGSSAAVTVATTSALAKLYDARLSQKELFDLSYEVVLAVQKTASGFDVAASVFGGTILFNGKNKTATPINSEKLPLMCIYSGKKASTVIMIGKVRQLKNNEPKLVDEIFSEISKIVNQAKQAVENCDWKTLGSLMGKNHELLVRLGVSNRELNRLVISLNQAGALGSKLSGAGGGDCVISLVPEDKRKNIEKTINNMGFKIVNV